MFTEPKIVTTDDLTKRSYITFYLDNQRIREYNGKSIGKRINPNRATSISERNSLLRKLQFEIHKALEANTYGSNSEKVQPFKAIHEHECSTQDALKQALDIKLHSSLSRKYKSNLEFIHRDLINFLTTDELLAPLTSIKAARLDIFLSRYNSSGTYYMNKRRDLGVLFNLAGKIADKPVNAVRKTERRKAKAALHVAYDNNQLKPLLNYLKSYNYKLYLCCMMTYATWLRPHEEVRLLTKADFTSGMRTVMDNLDVKSVLMHRPWKYWKDCQQYIKDGRITRSSFEQRLQDAYSFAYQVEQKAIEKGIKLRHPHQGNVFEWHGENVMTLLGPSKELYMSLIEQSDKTPAMRESLKAATKKFGGEKSLVYETMSFDTEHLHDADGDTAPENDMSLVMLIHVAGHRVLLTGDAGTMGLYKTINYAISKGHNLNNLDLMQVPHHGSRHNFSKGVLKYISAKTGLISCTSGQSDHHPSPVIVNALLRRNIFPISTQGSTINYHVGAAPGRGWGPAKPLSFINNFYLSD